jgi:nucleoside-diphosphate-sugar epimerase
LGARLSKHLAVKGYNVTVFDSYRPSNYNEWILLMDEIIIGDISDESAISRLADKNFDIVIHLISLDHYKSENDPNFVSSINVMPTWNLLDSFTKNGLKRFIYFSTIHVYGNLPSGIITEDQIPQPSNAYGLTHLLSENICNYYNEKTETECINVRLSNTYGSPVFKENNCWWLVINDLCKTAVENNEIRLKSDGSPQRDFIHGDDVAKAIDILINYKNNTGDNIFHIASGQILTILELAHRVKSVYTKMYDKEIDIILPDNSISEYPDSDNSKDIDRYVISTKRLKNLGFKQGLDLELGINEIFYYLKIGVV